MTATLPHISLRAVEPEDAQVMFDWENDAEMWIYSDTIAPLSRKIIREYAEGYDADVFRARQLRLIITADGNAVGAADLYDVDAMHSRGMAGIYVAERWRGRGVGCEALRQLCGYAERVLCLHHIFALVERDNSASLKAFERCGFEHIATLPQWRRHASGYNDALLMRRCF